MARALVRETLCPLCKEPAQVDEEGLGASLTKPWMRRFGRPRLTYPC